MSNLPKTSGKPATGKMPSAMPMKTMPMKAGNPKHNSTMQGGYKPMCTKC
jgi:hypothetical protein